jgi:hypothetical protein
MAPDIADAVIADDTVVRFIRDTAPDPRMQQVVFMHYQGYTHAEIAAALADGTTERAVEAMLHRYRKQVTWDTEEDSDDR